MTDYKEMYLKQFRANEQAINTLISAQQECETPYLNSSESELIRLFLYLQEKKKHR
ncbi:MAG: hypothetical protein RRZ42_02360 [Oscillospiraceae bacterium]